MSKVRMYMGLSHTAYRELSEMVEKENTDFQHMLETCIHKVYQAWKERGE